MPTYKMIKTPGKFEGCEDFVPEAWDRTLEGLEDERFDFQDGSVYYVGLDHIVGVYGVRMWEDGNGFVHSDVLENKTQWTIAIRNDEETLVAEETELSDEGEPTYG